MPEARPVQEHHTSPVTLVLSWAFVGIPLVWGVSQVFVKSLALFK